MYQLTPLERSGIYRQFAAAFQVPAVNSGDMQAFMRAFDPAVYKGACALYESAYTSKTQDLVYEELMRFYNFYQLHRASDAELPDHLSVELEFMHYLTYLEQQSQLRGEDTGSLRRAQRDFLARHLSNLSQGLCGGYQGDSASVIELIADFKEFVEQELQHLSVNPVSLTMPISPVESSDLSFLPRSIECKS